MDAAPLTGSDERVDGQPPEGIDGEFTDRFDPRHVANFARSLARLGVKVALIGTVPWQAHPDDAAGAAPRPGRDYDFNGGNAARHGAAAG